MDTRKLYYEDCHLKNFSARVLQCNRSDKGYGVILDATAFYPEGGGQACDTGLLGGVRVIDVQERDGAVVHLCDGPLAVGETVGGFIDYDRRFDLMQQHTGEHIVSGIIHRRFGYHNVGFHMGADVMEVDFDGPISPEELAEIEEEANRAVWANLPVKCWYPSEAELPSVGYRSKRALPWPVRVVEVPGFDKCACCGVHVAYTGEVGLVKIFSCVKFHQGVRLEIASGKRALDILNRAYEQNRLVSQAFSAKVMETGAAAKRMNEALAAEKYRAAGLQRKIFAAIAGRYANCGNTVLFEPELEPAQVRELAEAVADSCGGVAAVFSGCDADGYAVCLVSGHAEVKSVGAAMAKALNGRGGGKPGFFQGKVSANRTQIESFFSALW